MIILVYMYIQFSFLIKQFMKGTVTSFIIVQLQEDTQHLHVQSNFDSSYWHGLFISHNGPYLNLHFRLDLHFCSSFYSPSFIALSLSVGSGYHTCKILTSDDQSYCNVLSGILNLTQLMSECCDNSHYVNFPCNTLYASVTTVFFCN